MIGDGDSIHCELIFSVKVAVLSITEKSRDIPLKSDLKLDVSFVETTMFLLEKVVFLSENMHGSGSRWDVFIGNKELGNFIDLILTSMVYELD